MVGGEGQPPESKAQDTVAQAEVDEQVRSLTADNGPEFCWWQKIRGIKSMLEPTSLELHAKVLGSIGRHVRLADAIFIQRQKRKKDFLLAVGSVIAFSLSGYGEGSLCPVG